MKKEHINIKMIQKWLLACARIHDLTYYFTEITSKDMEKVEFIYKEMKRLCAEMSAVIQK